MRATLGLAAGLAAAALVFAAAAGAQPPPRMLPGLTPAAADGLSRALSAGRLSEAEYALERARSLFRLGHVRREFGDVERPGGRDATLILRDLAARLDDLDGAERRLAEAILARPTDGKVPEGTHAYKAGTVSRYTCGADMCFHWVETTADAPDLNDTTPADGIPDWVGNVQATWEHVWAKEIDEYHYRPPLDDSASAQTDGPSGADLGKLDVYVVNLGQDPIVAFGYCAALEDGFTTPVYCVVDDDYAEFLGQEPEAFLQVTSAHEFHHASQAAYDFWEDAWFIEGTATNIEETVYPDVDDNVNFLRIWSPLTRPGSPLDRGGFGDSEYGAWIFWRYLEEKVGGTEILRQIWLRARGDSYSLKATRRELAARGESVPDTFVRFAVTNRRRG
ncbi:MAG TPA: MXAN_6640 family putative metalloprotease, partial [Gaiellaceae bacterium]|nr:MXAN_6640 family putative metalloprotease [Gaiellaceae bacterium]